MSRWQKYAFTLTAAILTFSGCAYFWMEHFTVSDDPFAVVNDPWQPAMLDAHVLSAPALLILVGILFEVHVSRRLSETAANRRSGLLSLATIVVMTASGYLLQVTTSERLHRVWLIAHLGSGALFAIAYLVHLALGARLLRAQRALERRPAA